VKQCLKRILITRPGVNVGNYAIGQNTLASNSNYTISYTGNNLGITPASLAVGANLLSKAYGAVDPALTYTVSGLQLEIAQAVS